MTPRVDRRETRVADHARTVLAGHAVNGHFADYWTWHQHQQLTRNHLNCYNELDLTA